VQPAPPDAYWVDPGRLLAGRYPSSPDRLAEAGVTLVVDLTEEGELPPYGVPAGLRAVRVPIADFSCPTPATMGAVLDLIDAEVAAGGVVYVHCRGGLGRTGTVVACWLVRHGASAEDALAELTALRARTPTADSASPETPEQKHFVREFAGGNLDIPANQGNTVRW
jgi:protein-tyrosine phosphatase